MLDKNVHIDNLFRNELEGKTTPPPPYIWENIENALIKQKNEKRKLFFWRGVAAAAIALLISTTFLLMNNKQSTTLNIADNSSMSNVEKLNTLNSDITIDEPESYTKTNITNLPSITNQSDGNIKNNNTTRSLGHQEQKKTKSISKNQNFSHMTHIKSVQLGAYEHNLSTDKLKTSTRKRIYQPLYIAEMPTNSDRKKTLSIGGAISPAYNYRQTENNVEMANNSSNQESGISSLGGGINVRLSGQSRWSFETGVLYCQVGQETNIAVPTNEFLYAPSDVNSFRVVRSTNLNNSLGTIAVKNTAPDKHTEFAVDQNSYLANSVINNDIDGFRQTLDYLEVPFLARFQPIEAFPYITLSGGISTNFLIGNQAYSINEGALSKIGSTENMRPITISSSLGLGFNIPLNRVISFNLEPRFKYYLNSVNSDANFNYKPYSMGVFGGINIILK